MPMNGKGGRKCVRMHKSNDYVNLHNDNTISSVSRTHRCVYVCVRDLRLRHASLQVLRASLWDKCVK